MATKFVRINRDGSIECNRVRYNWKQARNMLADGSLGQRTGTSVWSNASPSEDPAGYKSYRSIVCTGGKTIKQNLPRIIPDHKYYLSCRILADTNSDWCVAYRDGSTDIGYAGYGTRYSRWTLGSTIIKSPSNSSPNVCIWNGGSVPIYASQFIMIDLTDTFGSGNEPNKSWCDNNIREHEVIVNYGCIAKENNSSYYEVPGRSTNDTYHNYLSSDYRYFPRDAYWWVPGSGSASEVYLRGKTTDLSLDSTQIYYGYWETMEDEISSRIPVQQSTDCYFPEAEPLLGQDLLLKNSLYNSGGGMENWKRYSFYNNRATFPTSTNNRIRFDFNNLNYGNALYACSPNLCLIPSNINIYNSYNGTNIQLADVNKSWCDRWIDNRSSSIIHIKDPNKTNIEFRTEKIKINRLVGDTYEYTSQQLEQYATLTSDSWSTGGADNSKLKRGDIAYIDCVRSDDHKKVRFFVIVQSVSLNEIWADNTLGYKVEGETGYDDLGGCDIVCNDIEIRPELNKVKFDYSTGTIYCKKLITVEDPQVASYQWQTVRDSAISADIQSPSFPYRAFEQEINIPELNTSDVFRISFSYVTKVNLVLSISPFNSVVNNVTSSVNGLQLQDTELSVSNELKIEPVTTNGKLIIKSVPRAQQYQDPTTYISHTVVDCVTKITITKVEKLVEV